MTKAHSLPKHPLERALDCPICKTNFSSIPVIRGIRPDDVSRKVEQHVCPAGHVYLTDVGGVEMLTDLGP